MTYQLLTLDKVECRVNSAYLEGAILAANMSIKPLAPKQWLTGLLDDLTAEFEQQVIGQLNHQYMLLKRNEYSALLLVHSTNKPYELADFAQGFMAVWHDIEPHWFEKSISDGTLRMLQGLLTTLSLAIDEQQTHDEMRRAGVNALPSLVDLVDNLDLMINEVALAADELQIGQKSQMVNPYKGTGRNDPCPCASGKKFKQCCGQ
jgi:uncharacterized protein